MTTDLSLTNLFEGKPINAIECGGEVWLPIRDLGAAWGLNRTTLYKHISRNKELFEGCVTSGDKLSPMLSGDFATGDLYVNETGLYLLIARVSKSRVKNPIAKEAIIKFRKDVPNLVQKYRKKEIVQLPKEPDYPGIIQKLKFVKELSGETGWNLLELQKEVLREAGMISLTYHIEPERPTLSMAQRYPKEALASFPPKPKDYLTATVIGERIGKTAHEVNMFLYNYKPALLIKDKDGGFRLTLSGKDYGEERYEQFVSGHFGWYTVWKKDILRLFNIRDEHYEVG